METVAKKHKGKAEFLFVYCREAHPDGDPRVKARTKAGQPIKQAMTKEEREATARTFCDDMKMTRRILIDEFGEPSAQRLYGSRPNPTVVIDVEGKIALKMGWTRGESLDRFLGEFLKGGGKFDLALAKRVPGEERPGGGGGGVPAEMVNRMLEGLDLTNDERRAARTALQDKMGLRGRLRQQALELDERARNEKATEEEIAKAVKDFEAAVADYQKRAADLDRKLTAAVSARARAQLLAAGILENGLGFSGQRPQQPPGAGGQTDGPWNHQIHVAFSKDGLRWDVVSAPLMKQASVPDLIELSGKKGTLCIYTVDARDPRERKGEGLSRLVSTDGGKTWGQPEPLVFDRLPGPGAPVDPSVVQLEDGRLRLYFYQMNEGPRPMPGRSDDKHRFYSAVSDDGLRFKLEEGLRFEAPEVTDPEVVRAGGEWLMFISRGRETLLARSADGLKFTPDEKFLLRDGGVPGALPLADGKVRVYQCGRGITSVVYDPKTSRVEKDEGVRIEAAADPAVWELAGGGYIMVLKSWMRPAETRPRPAPPESGR